MNECIKDYMSPAEAAYRWDLSINTLRQRLNINRHPSLKEDINENLVKGFTLPEGKSITWIISVKAMEKWYGPEPE